MAHKGQGTKGGATEERRVGLSRGQPEGAAAEHGGGDASHDRLGLDVKISVKLVGAPAADEADPVPVDSGTEKGHGATRPGGASGDGAGGYDGSG